MTPIFGRNHFLDTGIRGQRDPGKYFLTNFKTPQLGVIFSISAGLAVPEPLFCTCRPAVHRSDAGQPAYPVICVGTAPYAADV